MKSATHSKEAARRAGDGNEKLVRGLPRFARHGGNAAENEECDASHRDAKMPGYKRVAKLMGYDRAKE